MARVERFEELKIWQKAVEIAVDIFRISEVGSLKSDFSTKDQIRRSALSISSNIAEGFEYNSHLEFLRFLKYAKGSAGELRSQLFILQKLNLIEAEFYRNKFEELEQLSKQISSFMKYIKEFHSKK
ncbi:four helix bundle protein [Adhaeribacter arboris]|uniref:Four helix bundle protein n=1 Tax=Adhaeribacter arboris TaxID=2072846 RepID=A0A2T2YN29_9BACT|nr:four helix bundle protein [Adhaeribacter arboris]PSR56924.1 four helix bundle protein [Adhaeribacter arboris]